MLYRVSGTNKDTNAAMVLDIDAPSKAAAELKASARGMSVTGVEDLGPSAANHPTSAHRGEGPSDGATPDSGGMRNLVIIVTLLVASALIGYFTLPALLQRGVAAPPVTQPSD